MLWTGAEMRNGAGRLTTAVTPWRVYPWRHAGSGADAVEGKALGGPASPWLLKRPPASRAPLGGRAPFHSKELGVAPSEGFPTWEETLALATLGQEIGPIQVLHPTPPSSPSSMQGNGFDLAVSFAASLAP